LFSESHRNFIQTEFSFSFSKVTTLKYGMFLNVSLKQTRISRGCHGTDSKWGLYLYEKIGAFCQSFYSNNNYFKQFYWIEYDDYSGHKYLSKLLINLSSLISRVPMRLHLVVVNHLYWFGLPSLKFRFYKAWKNCPFY
jgi:hypothetical protein